jgi:hypothetical protein
MATITDAKRLIALSSDGIRILGAGVSRSCYQGRYNAAARSALEDTATEYTATERRLIASFIEEEQDETAPREFVLHVRLNEVERADLARRAELAGISMSEWVRGELFADDRPLGGPSDADGIGSGPDGA